MRLLAVGDLHLSYAANRAALDALAPHPGDWLLVAGDVAESLQRIVAGLALLAERFARVIWVPGNHELWTGASGLRGEARYHELVRRCRAVGVLTPEDAWPTWPGDGSVIAPVFLGYDYSFAPDGLDPEEARAWAAEHDIVCTDEYRLYTEPHADMVSWCHHRVARTEARLARVPADRGIVLLAHWPLRRDLVRLIRIPRFSPWCGTRLTEDWHTRFPMKVVVTGHLHLRSTDWLDGVRFEEVSLGYPRHWRQERGLDPYLREILPGPEPPSDGEAGPRWYP
jgi:3',5'-cyclic AMP phosphodiesterase CpdA